MGGAAQAAGGEGVWEGWLTASQWIPFPEEEADGGGTRSGVAGCTEGDRDAGVGVGAEGVAAAVAGSATTTTTTATAAGVGAATAITATAVARLESELGAGSGLAAGGARPVVEPRALGVHRG